MWRLAVVLSNDIRRDGGEFGIRDALRTDGKVTSSTNDVDVPSSPLPPVRPLHSRFRVLGLFGRGWR
jgi:hypothetical protein